MRTSVRCLPALLGILATAALSADVSDNKDKRLTDELLVVPSEDGSPPSLRNAQSFVALYRQDPLHSGLVRKTQEKREDFE
jgi:hypothetical protein